MKKPLLLSSPSFLKKVPRIYRLGMCYSSCWSFSLFLRKYWSVKNNTVKILQLTVYVYCKVSNLIFTTNLFPSLLKWRNGMPNDDFFVFSPVMVVGGMGWLWTLFPLLEKGEKVLEQPSEPVKKKLSGMPIRGPMSDRTLSEWKTNMRRRKPRLSKCLLAYKKRNES